MDTTNTTAAPAAAQPEAIQVAERLLRKEAERLQTVYCTRESWYGFEDEKSARDEHIAAADALAALAAPAAQEAEPIPSEPTDEMYTAAQEFRLPTGDEDGGSIVLNTSEVRAIWQAMRAAFYAHPPRPQADAGAVPCKATPDMRRVFREAYRVGGFWADRLDYALDRMLAAAPQAPAAATESALIDGVAYSVPAAVAGELLRLHMAALEAPAAVTAAALEQAWRAGWAACRDAEYVGEEAEDWAWGASATNGIAIDIEQSAPAAVPPEQEEVDFLVRVLDTLAQWSSEDWNELFERQPAIAELVRPLLTSHCNRPPAGWACSRAPGHEGPCAATTPPAAAVAPAAAPTQEAEDAARYRHIRACNSGAVCIMKITGPDAEDYRIVTEEEADCEVDAERAAIAARARQEGGGTV